MTTIDVGLVEILASASSSDKFRMLMDTIDIDMSMLTSSASCPAASADKFRELRELERMIIETEKKLDGTNKWSSSEQDSPKPSPSSIGTDLESGACQFEIRPHSLEWCRLQKILAQFTEKRARLIEEVRIAKVLADFEEEYPGALDLFECPLCCEEAPLGERSGKSESHFACCGKVLCMKCVPKQKKFDECPFCRCLIPTGEEEMDRLILANVEKGKAWAQWGLFNTYEARKVHAKERLDYLRMAADQGYIFAEVRLANDMYYECGGLVRVDEEIHRYARSAAEKGHPKAQYFCGMTSADVIEAEMWLQVAVAQGDMDAQDWIGCGYWNSGQKEKALYWFEKAAEKGNVFSQYHLGMLLLDLARDRYGSYKFEEHNVMPRVIYWLRKAVKHGHARARKRLPELEALVSSICGFCCKNKATCPNLKLFQCKRCKILTFCGKECITQGWKAGGHKQDCIKYEHSFESLPEKLFSAGGDPEQMLQSMNSKEREAVASLKELSPEQRSQAIAQMVDQISPEQLEQFVQMRQQTQQAKRQETAVQDEEKQDDGKAKSSKSIQKKVV